MEQAQRAAIAKYLRGLDSEGLAFAKDFVTAQQANRATSELKPGSLANATMYGAVITFKIIRLRQTKFEAVVEKITGYCSSRRVKVGTKWVVRPQSLVPVTA